MILTGTLRLSDKSGRRTAGKFSQLVNDNAAVFASYFGVELFPGSLNVDIPSPTTLQSDLDAGKPAPSFVIPKSELINMPAYIGDGQAWISLLRGGKFPDAMPCWIFRRVGSRVSKGVIELVAPYPALRPTYKLAHGDPVSIEVVLAEEPDLALS
jgi:CTP-dependent riboflavin kinase